MADFKYDVAFSFVVEDEEIATSLNDRIQDRVKTFLYSRRQEELAGKDGVDEFTKVFAEEARTVVILYRKKWGTTPWSGIEETAIKNRTLEDPQGHDFYLVIPTEKGSNVPKWVPKVQIWYDLERFGIEGAAAIIEKRVRDGGGAPHEETPAQRAARFERAREAESRRYVFLRGEAGVLAAKQEMEKVCQLFASQAEEIQNSGVQVVVTRPAGYPGSIVLSANGISLSSGQTIRYLNSLEESEMGVNIWKGAPSFLTLAWLSESKQLDSFIYQFDLAPTGESAWREEKGKNRLLSSGEVVNIGLHAFFERMEAERRQR